MKYKKRLERLFNPIYLDNFIYIWYKYHYHFFRSLIFRGRKLWAFNFLVTLKFWLKYFEGIDPLIVFLFSIINIVPDFLFFPLKMAGIINEVAMPIGFRKQIIFTIKSIVKYLKDQHRLLDMEYVCTILLATIREKGWALKRKKEAQLEAVRNRYLVKYFK